MQLAPLSRWRRAIAFSLMVSVSALTLGIGSVSAQTQEFRTKAEQLAYEASQPQSNIEVNPSPLGIATAPSVVFNGTGVGPIPDPAPPLTPQTPGAPLNVTFPVNGLTGNVTAVAVTITFNPAHAFAGDVVATLIAPNGTTQLDLFGYTLATTATAFGDSSTLAGPYTFTDAATGTGWWAAATAAAAGAPIASGSYRTSQRGGAGSTGANTSLNAVFAGLTPAQANGTWTLRVTDGASGDTGSVSAASIDITTATVTPTATRRAYDFFGDGRTSFATVRASGNNILWNLRSNGGATVRTSTTLFGLTSDFITPGYFDADAITDLNVWRPGTTANTQATYFLRPSTAPNTFTGIQFGRSDGTTAATNDFAGFEGDYDGDGRDDPTVLRVEGSNYRWFYLRSSNNTLGSVVFGLSSDQPLAGADYNGDGRADIGVARIGAGNAITYLIGDSNTGALLVSQPWGNFATDYIVIGDFVGDSKADFAVWRGITSATTPNAVWYVKDGGSNATFGVQWGIGGTSTTTRDIAVVGDYDGDNKSDFAVYRPSNNTYYWINSGTPTTNGSQVWGNPGDVPVGRFRTY